MTRDSAKPSSSRRSGRKERMALRAAKPEVHPCPPGQPGGVYRPLSEADLEAIFETALRLLETLGMGEVPDNLAATLLACGAERNDRDRFLLPRSLVLDAIEKTPKVFLHGRDPARSITVGGDAVHLTGGAAVQTLDMTAVCIDLRPCRTCTISPACKIRSKTSAGSPAAALRPTCPTTSIST